MAAAAAQSARLCYQREGWVAISRWKADLDANQLTLRFPPRCARKGELGRRLARCWSSCLRRGRLRGVSGSESDPPSANQRYP